MLRSLLLLALVAPPALAEGPPTSASPAGAELYFISPVDGATTGREVVVQFGLRGMGVAPAGINLEGTGHHHLLIDVDGLPPLEEPIPADERHVHFGKGQTEATITLEPGTHSLQLLLGDYLHRPHQPVVASRRITITVE
ncbi:DUF4399 domain-containing protein [Pseudomarimonas salicorniae]|uniref:DUF4399 domain-containing protein n=1 Tax=Pseudomarimonas salicorniae TaxID=2933270 RepID=A0ABT0GFN1_9GAMM|nr:DUF4399 domain-containing protein [Lysobacter sp. CAU 1642]MCK7593346.1 DUF4399 domain-containing protein [Lysobacter sp. CAU 1642]